MGDKAIVDCGFLIKLDSNGIVDWPAQLTAPNEIEFFSGEVEERVTPVSHSPECAPLIYATMSMSNAGHNSLGRPRSA